MSDSPANIAVIWEKFLILNSIDPAIKAMLDNAKPLSLHDDMLDTEIDLFAKDFLEKPEISKKLNALLQVAAAQDNLHINFIQKSDANDVPDANASPDANKSSAGSPAKAETKEQAPQITQSELSHQKEEISSREYSEANLQENLTFENFVRGANNDLAAAAAEGAAKKPGGKYNPLFFYSGVGLGKTHLMNAVGCYILNNFRDLKVLYITAEEFTNEFIESVQNNKMTQFRNKYRNIDVLLIDDIQFLISKEGTQDEFFNTFNSLYNAKKQIVVSSDRPPKMIPTLTDRLRSRFEMGLIADIQPPSLETRIAILGKKAQSLNADIPPSVLSLIAENFQSNVRELEGALTRLILHCEVKNCTPTLENARESLGELLSNTKSKTITIDIIKKTACDYFNITEEEMSGARRDQKIVQPRQIAMYLCKELIGASYPEIGQSFGGKDHSTVIHAYRKVVDSLNDPYFKTSIANIKEKLK